MRKLSSLYFSHLFLFFSLFVIRPSFAVPSERVRLLMVSANVGQGHISFEQAATQWLHQEWGTDRVDIQSLEVMEKFRGWQAQSVKGTYLWIIDHLPALYGFYFSQISNWSGHQFIEERFISSMISPSLMEAARSADPDLIVSTHPILTLLIDELRRRGAFRAHTPSVTFLTDFAWTKAYRTSGLLVVPHPDILPRLKALGLPPENLVAVPGMLARRPFYNDSQPANKSHLRQTLGVAPEIPLVLISGGGEGLGMDAVIASLLNLAPSKPLQLVFATGKNEDLRQRLENLQGQGRLHPHLKIVPLGFVQNMHDWMRAADLMVSKPGGSTLGEISALHLPLFVHSFIEGHEHMNFDFFHSRGWLEHVTPQEFAGLRILQDVDTLLARAEGLRTNLMRDFPRPQDTPLAVLQVLERACESAMMAKQSYLGTNKTGLKSR